MVGFWACLLVAALMTISAITGHPYPYPVWGSFVVGAAFFGFSLCAAKGDTPVDIWHEQTHLMRISQQQMAFVPECNHGLMLYYALIMEEMAETAKTLALIINSRATGDVEQEALVDAFRRIDGNLHRESVAMRLRMSRIDPYSMRYQLSLTEATQLLDDLGDVTVVVAGAGVSCGLPVRDGFREVQMSNASKANPKTGVIDKTQDGKWIKGPNYVAPDLKAILHQHYFRSGASHD